jgi:hypothetical protein
MSITNDIPHITAAWYAWGQQDAGIGRNVDAQEFAQHYAVLAAQPSRPSVQDAWKAYISAAAMADAETFIPVGIADEVRNFLSKAIDEAQP